MARISKPLLCIFAMRKAISLLSEPVLTKMALVRPAGIQSRAIVAASWATVSGIIPLKKWKAVSPARCTAATMAGWLWPTVAHIWPEVKSRISRPVSSRTMVPLAEVNRFGKVSPP